MSHKSSPYVSVIITAYNRKKYLLSAVMSALNQTLSRHLYEVIVVKNYEDYHIDSKLKEWGITSVLSTEKRLGAMFSDGLETASGNVISLLDDDDEFVPEKLQVVYQEFEDGAEYYHNGRVVINEKGTEVRRNGISVRACNEEEKAAYLNYLDKGPWVNDSSMSITRSILVKELSTLREVSIALDGFLFLLGLMRAKCMVDDPRPLTVYRTSSYHVGTDLSSWRTYLEAQRAVAERNLHDDEVMLRMSKGTPYQVFAEYAMSWAKLNYLALPDARPAFYIKDFVFLASFLPRLSPKARFHYLYRLLLPAMPRLAKSRAYAMRYGRVTRQLDLRKRALLRSSRAKLTACVNSGTCISS